MWTELQIRATLPVSRETGRRWARRRRLPTIAALAMQLKHEGDLGLINPTWSGWRLDRDGFLLGPEGQRWTVHRLNAWHFERPLLEELQRRLARPEQQRLF